MQPANLPLILSFGIHDPTGATGLQADQAVFAALGCHGLSVPTTLMIADTTTVDALQVVESDWVVDTARALLEDMPVAAFKLGMLGSLENLAAIAEVVADYPEIPLILDPFCSRMPSHFLEDDISLHALRDLLIPQSTVFQLSAQELIRLAESWRAPTDADTLLEDARALIESGCESSQITDCPGEHDTVENFLLDESGVVRRDVWQRFPGAYSGPGACLSAATTALLAHGRDIPAASLHAQEFTLGALARAQRLGMGRLIPDYFFWAREKKDN